MIWLAATALLLVAGVFVLWPLLTHWTPEAGASEQADPEASAREREELELDVASGRISAEEAARLREEVAP